MASGDSFIVDSVVGGGHCTRGSQTRSPDVAFKQEVTGGLTNRTTKLVHAVSHFGSKALVQRDAYNYTIQSLPS